ncbi:hypothetical protein N3K66_003012 [Trichothecium roseum]|uniref:Uncharacterized protein n=1 Tax=Trichothecium roseum TaxID=47278 RepID=A0ACC0V416_9HYPO|nr:hypothetical protein N3K66_003012 [Trichothecium roseum]
MATEVHCLTCFEALDAELNKRKPLSLEEIQSSWVSYVAAAGQQKQQQHEAPSDPALRRVAAADASTGSGSPASTSSSSGSSSSLQTGASTPATSISSLPLSSIVGSSGPPSTPLFVTWNTIENGDDDDEAGEDEDDEDNVSLRGCIGTFEPTPLSIGLPEYALISALQDTRFSPVRRRELPALQVAVTLLTDFEEVADPRDWVVGTHGVRLSFRDRGRRYGSTYLPDVAAEQGWTRDEALFSLARKAGWVGGQSRWRELDLRVTRYQGKKKSLSYARFRKWRDWVEQQQQ